MRVSRRRRREDDFQRGPGAGWGVFGGEGKRRGGRERRWRCAVFTLFLRPRLARAVTASVSGARVHRWRDGLMLGSLRDVLARARARRDGSSRRHLQQARQWRAPLSCSRRAPACIHARSYTHSTHARTTLTPARPIHSHALAKQPPLSRSGKKGATSVVAKGKQTKQKNGRAHRARQPPAGRPRQPADAAGQSPMEACVGLARAAAQRARRTMARGRKARAAPALALPLPESPVLQNAAAAF